MNNYDEQLKELQEQIASKNRVETMLKNLRKQREELSTVVDDLEAKKLAEQADVEQLEGRSLKHLFYYVSGKMDDKLTKEKREAYEAAVKYDAAYRELKAVEEDIRYHELEYGRVRRSNEKYQEVLNAKMEAIKAAGRGGACNKATGGNGNGAAAEIMKLEEKIIPLKTQEKELSEAISAGQSAKSIADNILSSLSSAEGWGTWDLFGGGLIADVAKYGYLDEAQERIEQLQVALRRFKTELADVEIQADMQVNIDGFLRFADYFFDGLFADWAVMNRIEEAEYKVRDTYNQIEHVLGKLSSMQGAVQKELELINDAMKEITLKASL